MLRRSRSLGLRSLLSLFALTLALATSWGTAAAKGAGAARPSPQEQAWQSSAQQFLRGTSKQARQIFNGPGARPALVALGQVLDSGVDRGLLTRVLKNPHAMTPRSPKVQPYVLPAVCSLAELGGRLPGVNEVLSRAAKAGDEGGARGALFELVGGAAVKRLGYKLGSLSFPVGKYETDGKVDSGAGAFTLVNMKSLASPKRLKGAVKKATSQLQLRNGKADNRPVGRRNPALLVLGQLPGVDIASSRRDWSKTAQKTGAPLTVIVVDQQSGAARQIFSSAKKSRGCRGSCGPTQRKVNWSASSSAAPTSGASLLRPVRPLSRQTVRARQLQQRRRRARR
jgi:hypothetical protein